MPSRVRSASKQRSRGPPPIFAGVDRQAPRSQRANAAGGTLRVTGKQCRLFDDDSGLAAGLEAGQHLLTCFGDEGITVDRFDARLLLPAAPVPPRSRAGASAPDSEEEAELDAERYRDLGGDGSDPSDSEADDANPRQAIPHDYGGNDAPPATSFQQVGYDYDNQQPEQLAADQSAPADADAGRAGEQQGEPFVAPFVVPQSLQANLPATMQQHKVIAQTAGFVREAGGQSEFRLGVAQAGNPNFDFLHPEDRLYPYYRWLLRTNPQEITAARSASLQGPTGLDMLAASYDTDQASDPPTPCAEPQPAHAANGSETQMPVEDAGAVAAAADVDFGSSHAARAPPGTAEAAAAEPAGSAAPAADPGGLQGAQAALPMKPATAAAEPWGRPGLQAAAAALPQPATLPAATQAIVNKLIDFVKTKGLAVGRALQRRESANPRFSFLQPGDALHTAWRAAAAEGLGADVAAQLLPAVAADESAASGASSAAAPVPAAAADISGSSTMHSAPVRELAAAAGAVEEPQPKSHAVEGPSNATAASIANPKLSSKPVAVIRSNPQLAQRIVGPLPQPKPKAAKSTYASVLAEFGIDDAPAAPRQTAAPAAAAAATSEEAVAEVRKPTGSPPPWLAAAEAAGGGSGSDSPGPAADPASQTPADKQAAAKKARRLRAAREALAAKQRAEAEVQHAAELVAAEAAARAAAAAAEEQRKQAEAAAAAARQRRRIFMGEEGEEPDAATQPPLLRRRLTSEELWARLQPTSAITGICTAGDAAAASASSNEAASAAGAAAGSGGIGGDGGGSSGSLSQQQLGMSVGNIMARLRAAEADEVANSQLGATDRNMAASGTASTPMPAGPAASRHQTSPVAADNGSGAGADGSSSGSDTDRSRSRERSRKRGKDRQRQDGQHGGDPQDRPKSSGSKRQRKEESSGRRSKHKCSKH